MTIIVIERDYSKPADIWERYLGAPCQSFDEAGELVAAHTSCWGDTDVLTTYVHNGTDVVEVSNITGEVLKEFFVRII